MMSTTATADLQTEIPAKDNFIVSSGFGWRDRSVQICQFDQSSSDKVCVCLKSDVIFFFFSSRLPFFKLI